MILFPIRAGIAIFMCLSVTLSAQNFDGLQKIDPSVLSRLEDRQATSCLIVMRSIDVPVKSPGDALGKREKGRFVYSALVDKTGQMARKALASALSDMNIPHRAFMIADVIEARLDIKSLQYVAALDEVKAITDNHPVMLEAPVDESIIPHKGTPEAEWGIRRIMADSVWRLGYTGENAVIGGQDTGYEWDHDALKAKYRGWVGGIADHNHNWHDAIREINPMHGDSTLDPENNPCGLDVSIPCDDHRHGTHTMGTMVGSTDSLSIGVAPMAKWIGCRNMERGYGTPSTYLECFEWFLAPTDLEGQNPNPDLAPHVINNSWSCPEKEGCNESNWHILETAVNNLRSAGIVVVVSAGNSGPGCASVNRPPAMYENAFSVGATAINDTIAAFSSRGPVAIDSSFRLKPDISAPGVFVRSALLNNTYGALSGTSMAGPHVAGTVALMISANPDLAGRVDAIEEILVASARAQFDTITCFDWAGDDFPNPVYGYGHLNALKAVEMALDYDVSATADVAKKAFSIYPNPVVESFSVKGSDLSSIDQWDLFDIRGHLLASGRTIPASISLLPYPPGLYILRLTSQGRIETLLVSRI